MGDEVLDRADLEAPFPREPHAALGPHHAGLAAQGLALDLLAVLDQLADDGGLGEPGEAAEVDARLGVAGPLPDAALLGAQREDVAGPAEVVGLDVGAGQRPAGQGAVVGADARGDAGVGAVDAERVGGALGVLRVHHHLRQLEGLGQGLGDGRADQARRVPHHEGHLLGRDVLGGDDQVAFVLAGGIIEDDHKFAIAWRVRALVDMASRYTVYEALVQPARPHGTRAAELTEGGDCVRYRVKLTLGNF